MPLTVYATVTVIQLVFGDVCIPNSLNFLLKRTGLHISDFYIDLHRYLVQHTESG